MAATTALITAIDVTRLGMKAVDEVNVGGQGFGVEG